MQTQEQNGIMGEGMVFKFLITALVTSRLSITLADFKYGVNTDVNIGVSVSRGGNTLFEVMGIC